MAVTFACTFHNRHHGTKTLVMGRDASIDVGIAEPYETYCHLYPAEWKQETQEKASRNRRAAIAAGKDATLIGKEPEYSYKKGELEVTNHMRNFIDAVRGLDKPRCGIDRAWEEAITIVMSVESYFKERKVKWDPVNEMIV
jgi:hypothetical protein